MGVSGGLSVPTEGEWKTSGVVLLFARLVIQASDY